MKIQTKPKRIISLLLALFLVVPYLNQGNAQAEASLPSSVSSHFDYFENVYTNLKDVDTHVFKTITFEDLVTLSRSKGTFALLIGGAWSDETQADIGYINEVAKASGVQTIYNFDTRLDGVNPNLDIATTHAPLTATSISGSSATTNYFDYTEYYVEEINQYFTNLSTLSEVPASYQNLSKKVVNTTTQQETTASTVVASGSAKSIQSPYLLIYNKDHVVNGVSAPVVSYLEKHGTNDSYTWDSYFKNNSSHVNAYKDQVKAVFDQAEAAGYSPSGFNTLTSWDFIAPAFNKNRASGSIEIFPSKTVNGRVVPDTGQNGIYEDDATLVFEHVTYHELTKILASQGNYAFLFGGSWCPNTQAEIRWINRYAKAHNIDKIYFFDTRLDAGVGVTLRTPTYNQHDQGTTLQTRDNETANPLAYLYGGIVDTYLKNIQTTYLITGSSSQTVTYTDPVTATVKKVNKLQVPYLFTYNKDSKDANGASAPIRGHVEIMNTWPNTYKGPFYKSVYGDTSPQSQYDKYDIAANDLFARLSRQESTPSGLIGVAPTVASAVYGQITGIAGRNLEYTKSGGTTYTAVSGDSITGLVPGTYQVRFQSNGYNTGYNPTVKPVTGTVTYNLDSFIEVIVPAFRAAPTGLHSVAETTYGGNDGKITANDGVSVTGLVYKNSEAGAYRPVSSFPITGLAPGEYLFKYEAQPGFAESDTTSVRVTAYGELLPPSQLTGVDTTLLNTDGSIQGWKNGEEYQAGYIIEYKLKSSAGQYVQVPDDVSSIDNLVPGVYLVRYAAQGQLSASQSIEITIKGQQAKPSGLTGNAPTSVNGTDGKISGTVLGLEFKKADQTSYNDAAYPTITGLTAGEYYIRYKAKDLYHQSDDTVVAVPAYAGNNNGNNSGNNNSDNSGSSSSTPTTPVDTGVVKTPVTGNADKVTVNVPSKTDPATGDTLATISKDAVTSLVENAKKSEAEGKSAVVELKVEATENTKTAQLTIPRTSFNEIATETKAEVKVDYAHVGTFSFDAKAVASINSWAATGDISLIISKSELTDEGKQVLGDRPVYDFSVFAGDSKVSSFGGGNVHISLPYTLKAGESPESVIVYYIDDEGQLLTVRGQFNSATGTVDFTTTHFSEYVIGYNQVSFADVQHSAWYAKAVSYLAARDITGGTDDTHYSPNDAVTRGQFIVLLLKAYGVDVQASGGSTANFIDAGNTYYTEYLAAAKNLGIATGTGDNQFSPDKIITREDLFTLLYRSLEKLGELPVEKKGASITAFKDADKISGYAHTAIRTLVESGSIAGSNDQIDPQGVATRAQVAQVLYNLLSK